MGVAGAVQSDEILRPAQNATDPTAASRVNRLRIEGKGTGHRRHEQCEKSCGNENQTNAGHT